MKIKNKSAMILAFIAGILLIISGINGFARWNTIKDFVVNNFVDHEVVQIIFALLIFIASLGGIAVIIGGYLIGKENLKTGRFFIMLGAGIGLIGFVVSLIAGYSRGYLTVNSFLSIGGIGLILSIVARMIAKK